MPDGVTPPDPVANKPQLEVPDASPDQATLDSKVDEILKEDGLNVPKPKEDTKSADDKSDSSDNQDASGDSDSDDSANDTQAGEDSGTGDDSDSASDEDQANADDNSTAELASNPDFSFEVQDADGKTYKITKIEDLPEDFDPKNNRQIMEIIAQANKLEGEIAKHEADSVVAEEQAVLAAAQKEIQTGWESEITELVDEKLLDKPKLAENNPKYKDDPANKKIDEVFKYIKDTNDARKKANNPNMLTSFRDAYDRMELRDIKAKQVEDGKKEGDLAKAKAGVIGTNSTTSTETPVYRAGSYRSMDDVPV